jgi:hypothetical protein
MVRGAAASGHAGSGAKRPYRNALLLTVLEVYRRSILLQGIWWRIRKEQVFGFCVKWMDGGFGTVFRQSGKVTGFSTACQVQREPCIH